LAKVRLEEESTELPAMPSSSCASWVVQCTHTLRSLEFFRIRFKQGVQVLLATLLPAPHSWPGGQLSLHGTHGLKSFTALNSSKPQSTQAVLVVEVPSTKVFPEMQPV
jgi:hypothetical protein